MKKREIWLPLGLRALSCPESGRRSLLGLAAGSGSAIGESCPRCGIDLRAWKGALDALGHDPVVWARPEFDIRQLPVAHARRDDLPLHDVVGSDDQQIAPFLARPERVVRVSSALSCCAIGVRTRTNRPGRRAPSLLSNRARAVSVPVRNRPAARHSRCGPCADSPPRPAARSPPGTSDRSVVRNATPCLAISLDRQNLRLAQGEIDVERIGLDDRRKLGRRPDADQRADIDKWLVTTPSNGASTWV